jgi:hypothetical protein
MGLFSFSMMELYIVIFLGFILGFTVFRFMRYNPVLWVLMAGLAFYGGRTFVLFLENNDLWHRTLGALLLFFVFSGVMFAGDWILRRKYHMGR